MNTKINNTIISPGFISKANKLKFIYDFDDVSPLRFRCECDESV